MHTVAETLAILAQQVRLIAAKTLDLTAARGAVLAQDVRMDQDSPPFDRSQLDGYAVMAAEALAGTELEVIGRADAGGVPFGGTPGPRQCVAINTGAIVPPWADAVLMVEQT